MSVSTHRLRQASSAAAVALAVTLALPTAALADAPQLAACDDLLVTISPGSTTGDAYAAAVTSQALVADVAGWESASWAVADSTDLREVLVLHSDGTTRSLGAQRNGTADDVLALGFCGATGDALVDAEVVEDDVDAVSIDPAPAPAPEPKPAPAPAPEPAEDVADEVSVESSATTTDEVVEDHLEEADDEASDADEEDEAAVFAGPIGPTTAPYHDAGITNAGLTAAAASRSLSTSTMTDGLTLAAATTEASSTALPRLAGATADQGASAALVALFAGAALALVLLGTRRRFTREVHA